MTATKMLWGPGLLDEVTTGNSALIGLDLNNSTRVLAWIFNVPSDGSITDVGFYLVSKTGSPPNYNAAVVTLDSSGRPTTTAYGGSAVTAFTPGTAGNWQWVTLSTPATAAAGDWIAARIYPTGSAPDGSNFINVTTGAVAGGGFVSLFNVSWTVRTGGGLVAVRYSDGSVYGYSLNSNTMSVTVRSNTTPDEVGCKFQLPAAMTCYGASFYSATAWGASTNTEVVLYDGSNNVLASFAITDRDFVTNAQRVNVYWDAVNLAAFTDYRLVIKPTVGTGGDAYPVKWDFGSTAGRAYVPEGVRWQWTERTDAGAWTDTSTAVAPMALWVSDITFVQGSGSGGAEWGFVG